jgi:ribonucleoside-triphosphate reductase
MELHPNLTVGGCGCETVDFEPVAEVTETAKTILFATKTCPNCKMATVFLDKGGVQYEKVYAEENPELVRKYGIMQAPTLVVVGDDGNADLIQNVSNIRKYVDSLVKA